MAVVAGSRHVSGDTPEARSIPAATVVRVILGVLFGSPARRAISVGVGYLGGALLCNEIAYDIGFTTFWAPSGVLLGALAIARRREWVSFCAAAAVANLLFDFMVGHSMVTSVLFTAGNVAESVIGAWLFLRVADGAGPTMSASEFLKATAGVVLIAVPLNAVWGAGVLLLTGGSGEFLSLVVTWWSSDVVGAVTIAPLIVMSAPGWAGPKRTLPEFAVLLILIVLGLVFGLRSRTPSGVLHAYVMALPLIWSAVRFGPRVTASAAALTVLSGSALASGLAVQLGMGDGQQLEFQSELQVLFAVAVIGSLLLCLAVDESRRGAQQLARSEARFRALVTSADDIVFTLDRDLRYDGVYGHWPLAKEADDLFGKTPLEAWGPVAGAPREHAAAEALAGVDATYEIEDVTSTGERRVFQTHMTPLVLHGEIAGVVGIGRDVTGLRRNEQSLLEDRASLTQLVDERTADLQAAVVELQAAVRVRDDFLTMMSHELRTPLNSIIGFTGVVMSGAAGPLTEEQRTQLGFVRSAGERLNAVLADILELTALSTGHTELTVTQIDLCELLSTALSTVSGAAELKGLKLTTNCDCSVHLRSDERRLALALGHVLDNAVKFTDQGEIDLCVERGILGVDVVVSDTGCGIPAEALRSIMEPFSQSEAPGLAKPQGTGVGLTVVRRTVVLLGGELIIESEEGRGTAVTIRLPLEPRQG